MTLDELLAQPTDIVGAARKAFAPPPRLQLAEWADEKFYLSAESSAEPGRWRTLPYQVEPMNAMSDPLIEQVSFMKSARVGYTKMLTALVGYHVEHDPCPILLIQPDEDSAKGHVKDEIEPMIRDCPDVGSRFIQGRTPDPMLRRRFRGGVLHTVGARSAANFRRVSRRLVEGDEIDGYPASAGKEGDPITLAKRRSEYYWNRKWVWGSTPTFAGASRIEQLFFQGDQRRYYVPCPHCRDLQVLQFKNLRWDHRPPEQAVFVCIHCGAEIEHLHKRSMIEQGEWRPGPHAQLPDDPPPGTAPGHRSYHIWAAYSYSPNASWGDIAVEFLKANKGGPDQLQPFVNTWLGETWKEKGDAPAWRRLYDRREDYAPGSCPKGVLFLTAGVDVQRNGLVWEVVGWGRGNESWSIDRGFIEGDTSDLTPKGPWVQLDALLDRTFRHEDGAEIRVRKMAVDSGDQTQFVYSWVRAKGPGRVMAVKGTDSASVLVSQPSKVDVSVSGKRIGTLLLWRVGKSIGTSELYGWLKLSPPTDEEREAGATAPAGYCHFPQYDEQFFKQLTALQLVTHKSPKGFTVQSWEVIPGREDHCLDARRYARAAASVIIDRFKESNWALLEKELGRLADAQAVEAAAPTPDPDAPPPEKPSPLQKKRFGRSRYLGR